MKFFKYKEDRLPVFVITCFCFLDLTVVFTVDNLILIVLWGVMSATIKAVVAAWNHNHQHCNTFYQPFLNRLIEIMYGMHTGVCGHAWVLHHNIGHHSNYLDQTKDESSWTDKLGRRMPRLRYSFEIFITSYYRCFKVGLKHPEKLAIFLTMTTLTTGLMALITFYRPIPGLLILWIPYFTSLFITADVTYFHHSGLSTDDPYGASYNTIGDGCYNKLTGNFGYHTAHHINGGLHWTKLPALHERYKDRIPEECYVEVSPFFKNIDRIVDGFGSGYNAIKKWPRSIIQ